jgi:GDP-L-fucose synthase
VGRRFEPVWAHNSKVHHERPGVKKLKIVILGKGLVGSALIQRFSTVPNFEIIGIGRRDCDLRDRLLVENLLQTKKPDLVILAAGVVGGIEKNLSSPAELIMENSRIILNVLDAAVLVRIPKLINLVPACVYPAQINRRMKPEDLFSGPMEQSSLSYSTAKLAGVVMVSALRKEFGLDWVSAIITNLYGDNLVAENYKAHVIPALVSKFSEAKRLRLPTISLLGNGLPIREFLHVEDFAEAVLKVIELDFYDEEIFNIAGKEAISIRNLAELIKRISGYEGSLTFNNDGKNGAPKKLLDGSKIHELGWNAEVSLESGLERIFSKV